MKTFKLNVYADEIEIHTDHYCKRCGGLNATPAEVFVLNTYLRRSTRLLDHCCDCGELRVYCEQCGHLAVEREDVGGYKCLVCPNEGNMHFDRFSGYTFRDQHGVHINPLLLVQAGVEPTRVNQFSGPMTFIGNFGRFRKGEEVHLYQGEEILKRWVWNGYAWITIVSV